jgi:hypothetical protein
LGHEPIRLADIANVEAFVEAAITKSRIPLEPGEREVLLSEGLTILYELYSKYKPGVGGRDATRSRFSGYAAMFLPRRLGDAWRRSHRDSHRYVTNPDTGQRGWVYAERPASLEQLREFYPELS